MTQLESLKISLLNFSNESNRVLQFLDNRFGELIFYPSILEADIDYKSFCGLLKAIKEYQITTTIDDDAAIIKEKIAELPLITQTDFEYYTLGINSNLLFIFFPVGVIVWLNAYLKLSSLQTKLKEMERTLGTLNFMLKAMTSN